MANKNIHTISEIKSNIGDFNFVREMYRNRKILLEGANALSIELHAIAIHIVRLNDIIFDLERLDKKNEKATRKKWFDIHEANKKEMRAAQDMNFHLQFAFCRESEQKYFDKLWFILS